MIKNIFQGAICLLFILSITSCHKTCTSCMHGGSCQANTCSCPDPYSGSNCDTMCELGTEGYMCRTLSREKFLGTWSCTSSDQTGNAKTYLVTFSTNSYPLFMNMNNFGNDGGHPLVCTMVGKNTYDIDPSQQDPAGPYANASGECYLKEGKITMYFNTAVHSNVPNHFYFATATRQ